MSFNKLKVESKYFLRYLIDKHWRWTALRRLLFSIIGCVLFTGVSIGILHALGGVEGTFEYAFDAPWRMEPYVRSDGQIEYGAIPIQLSIHDAIHAGLDDAFSPGGDRVYRASEFFGLGNFCQVTVREPSLGTTYLLEDLAEVEVTGGAWPWPMSSILPAYAIRRAWAGQSFEQFRDLSLTSEWHALLWYEPRQDPTPGSVLPLEIEVQVTRRPWITCDGVESGDHPLLGEDYMITLRNHVRVYFGDEPLPRFDNNWLYGDLHYHSQGTDNEGESAYNYRGVIRAMGAMGLDFLFATEHASNSEQIIDADIDVQLVDPEFHDENSKGDVLRDMSEQRFAFNHRLIYGENGVNREAALNAFANHLPQGYLSHGVVPQIFLGGEVDVIPEVASGPLTPVPYGNGREYHIGNLCGGWNSESELLSGGAACVFPELWEAVPNGYLIRDVQGINDIDYGREHMVYLPKNSKLKQTSSGEPFCEQSKIIGPITVTFPVPCAGCEGPCPQIEPPLSFVDTAFIPSYTGTFGGAGRRLADPHQGIPAMLPEIEEKGYAFIAHHLIAPESGTPGPDGPPWSEYMLRKAWASPAVLGLQFWNEDGRLHSDISGGEEGYEIGYERDEDYGGPKPVNSFRRGFANGAGLFELVPFDIETGRWGEVTESIEHTLHHGAFSWDVINHWGLDLYQTRQLPWLAEGEPRRFFMAGGSDAHGDLNYRRAGYFLGTTETNDTAIGKPRNLVLAGPPKIQINPDLQINHDIESRTGTQEFGGFEINDELRGFEINNGQGKIGHSSVNPTPHTQEQIIEALHKGRFSVTDGPALRIGVDRNGNNRIDGDDVQMGGIVHLYAGEPLKLLVEWMSTPEFGPLTKIDLYVGVQSSQNFDADKRTYAPQSHGIRDVSRDPLSNPEDSYTTDGRTYTRMDDRYWLDPTPTGSLRIRPMLVGIESFAYHGTSARSLDLDQFQVIRGNSSPGDRFFIRAFAMTDSKDPVQCDSTDPVTKERAQLTGLCLRRYAFTNPIWVIRHQGHKPVEGIKFNVPNR